MIPFIPLLVNFGGPRSLQEIEPFLIELLTDRDVVRTGLSPLFDRLLFTRIAKKRAPKIRPDYESIGGSSPIHADTEEVAAKLASILNKPVLTFHRYLPSTHPPFLQAIAKKPAIPIRVFPLFPQFTYATTGSIARWMDRHLPPAILHRFEWIRSYPTDDSFITPFQQAIRDHLKEHQIPLKDTTLIFSAHGIPKKYARKKDPYPQECEASYQAIRQAFPTTPSLLCYQSKFGPGEWLRPYTSDVSRQIDQYAHGRSHVVFVPLTFTSDHIETLFEVEEEYMKPIRERGYQVSRVSALGQRPTWIEGIAKLLTTAPRCSTQELIRKRGTLCFD